MVITDREIQKDLQDQDQDSHKDNRQESENDTSGLGLITDLKLEETKKTKSNELGLTTDPKMEETVKKTETKQEDNCQESEGLITDPKTDHKNRN